MSNNLSPEQFQHALEADRFDKWAKGEMGRITKEHEVAPGHSRFTREAGRNMARLRKARVDLTEAAAYGVHTGTVGLDAPLRDLLPDHTDLVDQYENRGQ